MKLRIALLTAVTVLISLSNLFLSVKAEAPQKVEVDYNGEAHELYAIPGEGEYKGWEQLKGFPGESLLAVYFMHGIENGLTGTSYQTNYIGKYNFSNKITWLDGLGALHITSLGEMFGICSDNPYSIPRLEKVYGAIFDEWWEIQTIRYYDYVEDYLVGVGRQEYVHPIHGTNYHLAESALNNEPAEWIDASDIGLSAEEKMLNQIGEVKSKATDDYFTLLNEYSDFYKEEWISERIIYSVFGVSCVPSLDESDMWEIFKDNEIIRSIRFSPELYEASQTEAVHIDGLRVYISDRTLVLNVLDLISLGLIDSEKFIIIPSYEDFINESIYSFILENYPERNPEDHITK